MLIDDDQDFLDTYSALLGAHFNVEAVTSFEQARALLENRPYGIDLVFCDIYMPNTHGFEVLQNLAKDQVFKKIPFMFKTSSPDGQLFENVLTNFKVEIVNTLMSNEEILSRVKRELAHSSMLKIYANKKLLLVVCDHDKKIVFPESVAGIELSDFEIHLCRFFANSNTPVPKETIVEVAYSKGYFLTDNNFNTLLSNFRKKIQLTQLKIKNNSTSGVSFCLKD